jgi:hypothetical protein
MATEYEYGPGFKKIMSDLSKNANDVAYEFVEILNKSPEDIFNVNIDKKLDDLLSVLNTNDIYFATEHGDDKVDPCLITGFYLRKIAHNIPKFEEKWNASLASRVIDKEEIRQFIYDIRDLSSYAGKCAAKYKD